MVIQELLGTEFPETQPFTNITVDEFLFKVVFYFSYIHVYKHSYLLSKNNLFVFMKGKYLPYIQSLSETKGETLMHNYTFGLYYNVIFPFIKVCIAVNF